LIFNKNKIANILTGIQEVKVLIIGDVMLDRYILGNVDRISPEAPIPILKKDQQKLTIGGAGNVLQNLVSLNVKTSFISIVGDDDAAKELIKQINKLNNVEYILIKDKTRKTTVKTRYIAAGQQIFRSDSESEVKLSSDIKKKAFNYYKLFLNQSDIVIFSDYGKGIFFDHFCEKLIKHANKLKKKVIVDPKGNNFLKYNGSYFITPNTKEAFNATKILSNNNKNTQKCGKYIINKKWSENVLLTRGSDGLSIIEKNKTNHLKANTEEIFDVTGAGDTVISLFAAVLAAKFSILEAANFANLGASIVVKKSGTSVTTIEEINNILSYKNFNLKIVTKKDVIIQIKKWKKKKFKIGFTNGCFDLIHSGHIDLLTKASEKCDKLIVALNSDTSIKKIKGLDRPILDLNSRKRLIAALEVVDLVTIFNESTPINLIKIIKPDFLIKGEDYKINEIVGSNYVKSYSGKIIRIKLTKNQSTSNVIKKIKKSNK
tara:strand:- start:11962 stop:13425 length:1464 start_codon:yes stop_codon:yes gene_type:complete